MYPRIRIDSKGAITAEDPNQQKELAARAGSYYLAPTSNDLLCLIRTPATGAKINAPRFALAGDASSFALSDLIAFLSQSRWTGIVRVHAPSGERAVALKEGEIRAANSDDPADRLGEVMVRLGYVTRQALDQALRDNPPSRIGRTLVERGLLQAHDLFKCVTHQVSEIFHAIVLCREGSFALIDQPLDDRQLQNIQLSTQSLLMDSIRKIDEMAHFRKRIKHGRMYVAKKKPSDGKLEPEEDLVLSLCAGDRTVLDIGQAAKLTEFDVTKAVFRLLEGHFVQVGEEPMVPVSVSPVENVRAATPAPQVAAAPASAAGSSSGAMDAWTVIRTFNAIFREVRDEVHKRGMSNELLASANAALKGQGLSSSPALAGLAFDSEGNLPEHSVHAQFERARNQLGSEPVASLKQALSDVMFFLLFQAGELLESEADEALARRVKALLAKLDR